VEWQIAHVGGGCTNGTVYPVHELSPDNVRLELENLAGTGT